MLTSFDAEILLCVFVFVMLEVGLRSMACWEISVTPSIVQFLWTFKIQYLHSLKMLYTYVMYCEHSQSLHSFL